MTRGPRLLARAALLSAAGGLAGLAGGASAVLALYAAQARAEALWTEAYGRAVTGCMRAIAAAGKVGAEAEDRR